MKMRNKGKVHPFTSSSSSSSSSSSPSPNKDYIFSVLKSLPSAILTLVSVLSLEEKEVLAYMITRSLHSVTPSSLPPESKQKSSKKQSCGGQGRNSPGLFDCDCFHCYTSFWFRWDSSPNRELIHQAIEAFEEHLNKGEEFKKSGNGKNNKRKEKTGRRKSDILGGGFVDVPAAKEETIVAALPKVEMATEESGRGVVEVGGPAVAVQQGHKGLARKVLPDVMGIFNSRLWSLWSPNM